MKTKSPAPKKRTAKSPEKKSAAKPSAKPAVKRATRPTAPTRKDLGAPVDVFFRKPFAEPIRSILKVVRKLVESSMPEAESSLKWGMPFYCVNGHMTCAIGAHKAHVNLIMVGPPTGFDDPDGILQGKNKGGRHVSMRSVKEIPSAKIRAWLRVATKHAKSK